MFKRQVTIWQGWERAIANIWLPYTRAPVDGGGSVKPEDSRRRKKGAWADSATGLKEAAGVCCLAPIKEWRTLGGCRVSNGIPAEVIEVEFNGGGRGRTGGGNKRREDEKMYPGNISIWGPRHC